jgi:hypothetical protein
VRDYGQLCERIAAIDSVVVKSREYRENRIEYYDDILQNHLPALEKFFTAINGTQDLMNEELEAERKAVKKDDRRYYIANGLAIVFFIVSCILSVALAWPDIFDWSDHHHAQLISLPLPPSSTELLPVTVYHQQNR